MTMEKTYSEYINAILDAAEITSNRALQKATFDKTVMGNIVACTDAAAGKYKVKVQDAYYYATINNEDEKYFKGDNVYILIPGNDNTKPKKIIGNVEMLGDAHLAISALESQFEKMSQNVVTKSKDYLAGMKYSSYGGNQEDILYNVYIDDLEGDLTNKINIDTGALSSLAKKAEKIHKIEWLCKNNKYKDIFGFKPIKTNKKH